MTFSVFPGPGGADFVNSVADATRSSLGRDNREKSSSPTTLQTEFDLRTAAGNVGPKNLWKIDGQQWADVFGYRFSVAVQNPEQEGTVDTNIANVASGGNDSDPLGFLASIADNFLSGFGLGGAGSAISSSTIDWKHFTLPIPPQNIIVKPVMTSRATPTLGGVVEETSAVKFFLINLSGTTGIAPSRASSSFPGSESASALGLDVGVDDRDARTEVSKKFRQSIETTGLLAGTAARAQRFTSQTLGSLDAILAGTQSGSAGGVIGGLTGALNNAFLPPLPYSTSGVDRRQNGFTEANELQRFFFMYQALKGRFPKNYALVFSMFKTDQSFRCIVKDVQIQKSAESPMLYRYKIDLQCWNPMSARKLFAEQLAGTKRFDRFAAGGDLQAVNTLFASDDPSGLLARIDNLPI